MCSDGKVGIGTTTPLTSLHVNGTVTVTNGSIGIGLGTATLSTKLHIRETGADHVYIKIETEDTSKKTGIQFDSNAANDCFFNTDGSTDNIRFYNSSAKMTIKLDGSVGIGTTAPGSTLEVTGSSTSSTDSSLNITDSGATSLFKVMNDGVITVTGNVGIGDTTSTEGTVVIRGTPSYDPTDNSYAYHNSTNATGAISTDQGALSYSIWAEDKIASGELNIYSDKRIKKIEGVSKSVNDLNLLNRIEITDYSYIDFIGKGNNKFNCKPGKMFVYG